MHLDNLIFILLIAMAALLRLLASKARSPKKSEPPGRSTSPSPTSQPVARPLPDTDEERIRRFLEALGQPTSSKPPAPVLPRTDIAPRPLAPVQPPPTMFPIPTRMRRRVVPTNPTKEKTGGHPPLPSYGEARKPPAQPAAEPVFEIQRRAAAIEPQPIMTPATEQAVVTQPDIVVSNDKIDIAVLLSSPSALRNAIILREIFGPPRSLQAFDFLSAS